MRACSPRIQDLIDARLRGGLIFELQVISPVRPKQGPQSLSLMPGDPCQDPKIGLFYLVGLPESGTSVTGSEHEYTYERRCILLLFFTQLFTVEPGRATVIDLMIRPCQLVLPIY